jgi:hypothetical protein
MIPLASDLIPFPGQMRREGHLKYTSLPDRLSSSKDELHADTAVGFVRVQRRGQLPISSTPGNGSIDDMGRGTTTFRALSGGGSTCRAGLSRAIYPCDEICNQSL